MSVYRAKVRLMAGVVPLFLVAACGGGGGGGVSSTPAPSSSAGTSNPTTTPTTTPESPTTMVVPSPSTSRPQGVNYDDAEYRLSSVAAKANAVAAYDVGATGTGVKIAILDSGLTDANGQFAGRIDAASKDFVGNRGIGDEGGHGTSVAAIAAAGRNGQSMLGVAFDATLLVARTDNVGSCVSQSGCSHNDDTLARAVDYARSNGAKVINMSLGGSTPNNTLISAVRNAASAGIVVVISAGNDGGAVPDAFAQMAGQSGMGGLVIIAGSHDAANTISSFSNRAGSYGQYYLAAMGEAVRGFNQTGNDYLFSGTSYSAPGIAGAVALLSQAFPTLTPKQIVDLLYATATDAGDPGVDAVYGRGILNLAKAFQPQGSLSLSGSAVPVSLDSNGTLSSAMGDAMGRTGTALSTSITDGYGRAFTVDLSQTIDSNPRRNSLAGTLIGSVRTSRVNSGTVSMSMNLATNSQIMTPATNTAVDRAAAAARFVSGTVSARLDAKSSLSFGIGEKPGQLANILDGRVDLPFLVAQLSDAASPFTDTRDQSFAMKRQLGRIGLTAFGASGAVRQNGARVSGSAVQRYQSAGLRASTVTGHTSWSFGLGTLMERSTVLGARFNAALGNGGAVTYFADSSAAFDIGDGWSAMLSTRQALSVANSSRALVSGRIASSAYSAQLTHSGASGQFGVRVAQPFRVSRGSLRFALPSAYDYTSQHTTYSTRSLDVAPMGRQLDVEAVYSRRLGIGWIDANLYLSSQPGNVVAAGADTGMAVRYSMRF